jgi:predicted lipoprotein with Yx(FWY)xxD motif
MRRNALWLAMPFAALAVVGAGAAMAATLAHSGGTVKAMPSSGYGHVLVAANGRTLYRYTPDKKGVRVCSGACLKFWPPLVVKTGTKPTAGTGANAHLLGTIKFAKGKAQVTYAGYPLYLFADDKKAGQTKGEGFDGTWYVVSATGALVKHRSRNTPPPPPTTTSTSTSSGAWG